MRGQSADTPGHDHRIDQPEIHHGLDIAPVCPVETSELRDHDIDDIQRFDRKMGEVGVEQGAGHPQRVDRQERKCISQNLDIHPMLSMYSCAHSSDFEQMSLYNPAQFSGFKNVAVFGPASVLCLQEQRARSNDA